MHPRSKRTVNGVKVDIRDTPFPLEQLQGGGEGEESGEEGEQGGGEGGGLRVEVEVQVNCSYTTCSESNWTLYRRSREEGGGRRSREKLLGR